MRILVSSDNEGASQRVLEALKRRGLVCPPENVVRLKTTPDRACRLSPDLLIMVLSQHPEDCLEALRETTEMVRCHVLVAGPADDPKSILNALHSGGDEYLDEASLDDELAAALVRMKARESQQKDSARSGRVISVLGASGGSGASTVAANLATVLAKQYGACGLLDLRLAVGDLASLLDLKPAHSIADLCTNLSRLDRTMFEQFLVRNAQGVHLMAAPRTFQDVDKVTTKGVRRLLSMSRERFPYVVTDLDNRLGIEQVVTACQSDVVLLVLRLDFTSLRNTRRAIDYLIDQGLDAQRLRLVMNRFGEHAQLSLAQVEHVLEFKIHHLLPDDPRRVNRAINSGVPVVLQKPKAKISRSFVRLTGTINGQA